MAIISFYGAWRAWEWPIWGGAFFAFPFIIRVSGNRGFYSFFNRRNTPPLVRFIRSLSTSRRWCALARGWRAAWTRSVDGRGA